MASNGIEYRGLPIRKHSAAIRGASGDALNGALKVAPQEFLPGDKVYMVLELRAAGDKHDPMDDGEAWEHVDVLKVERGAFFPAKTALPLLDEVAAKLEEIRAQESGQERLGLDDEMIAAHDRGEHRRKRKACPRCYEISPEGVQDEVSKRRRSRRATSNGDEKF